MIADCLTKKMKPDALWPAMHRKLDLVPTPESVLTKLRKQKLRRKTDDDEEGEEEQQHEDYDEDEDRSGMVNVEGERDEGR